LTDLFGADIREGRKNFSRNNVGQRRAGDFYQTPPSMTRQFLDVLPVVAFPVLEPARGKGAIESVLRTEYPGKDIEAYDLADGIDFLEEKRTFPELITNPPFSLSLEFILKCKEVATSRFSLLMPIDYLHGAERYRRVFSVKDGFRLAWIHVFTRRAMMSDKIRSDECYETGMITWAWYTWLRFGNEDPRIQWIDNDEYVVRKGDR
jgi:hypothetical protein